MQQTVSQYNILSHPATHRQLLLLLCMRMAYCIILQQTTSHSFKLHRTAFRCKMLYHTASHQNTLQHSRSCCCFSFCSNCSTLQHAATHCNTPIVAAASPTYTAAHCEATIHCNTLQHTASQCITMHHTASHCITTQHTATRQIVTHCNTPRVAAASPSVDIATTASQDQSLPPGVMQCVEVSCREL